VEGIVQSRDILGVEVLCIVYAMPTFWEVTSEKFRKKKTQNPLYFIIFTYSPGIWCLENMNLASKVAFLNNNVLDAYL